MAEREAGKPWGTVELAQAAGVSDAYIRMLLADNKLYGHKIGRTWFIPDHVARAWLEERKARWH